MVQIPNSVSFFALTEFRGENSRWVSLSLFFVCQSELTEFFPELTEFAAKVSEAQWVLSSETALSKQYSARFLKGKAAFLVGGNGALVTGF